MFKNHPHIHIAFVISIVFLSKILEYGMHGNSRGEKCILDIYYIVVESYETIRNI